MSVCKAGPLWAGLLAAPLAWAVQLQVIYALTQWTCHSGSLVPLHATAAACLLIAAAGLGVAFRCWQAGGRRWPSDADEGLVARTRFMAALGLMAGGLFSLLIVVQWTAVLFLDPCPV